MTPFQDSDTLHTMGDAQEHSGLIFFPFTNNLLSSLCEMLSQEPWHKGLAQVVIDILETYLILKQSDLCYGFGVCPNHTGIMERVGQGLRHIHVCHRACSAHTVPVLHKKVSLSRNYTHISALGLRNTFHPSLQVKKKWPQLKYELCIWARVPSKSSFCFQQKAWFFCRWNVARMKQTSWREEHLAGMLKWLPSAESSITWSQFPLLLITTPIAPLRNRERKTSGTISPLLSIQSSNIIKEKKKKKNQTQSNTKPHFQKSRRD